MKLAILAVVGVALVWAWKTGHLARAFAWVKSKLGF